MRYRLLLLLLTILITGCKDDAGTDRPSQIILESGPLRIMHPDKDQFMNNYGNTFQIKHPGIELEVISSLELAQNGYKTEEVLQFISKNRPDFIVIDPISYQKKEVQKLLHPLEPLLQQDGIELGSFVPSIIGFLNNSGKIPLYGLTPSFSSQAIFWNRELFDRYGVPHPNQLMSWEDVLKTAKRFPVKDDIYGLYESHPPNFNPFTLFSKITETYGLNFAGPDGAKRLQSDPLYLSIWEQVMDAYRTGYVYNPLQQTNRLEGANKYESNLFLRGRAAMYVDTKYFLKYLRDAPKNNLQEINWEMAVMPVNPRQPDVSNAYNIREIYALRTGSENLTSAWTLLRHIHSDETAKMLSMYDDDIGIVTKIADAKDHRGRELSAFFQLKPDLQEKETYKFRMEDVPLYRQTIMDVSLKALNGTISGIEALEELGSAVERLYDNN